MPTAYNPTPLSSSSERLRLQLDEELLAEGSAKTPQERDDGDPLGRGVFQSRPRAVGREEGQVRDDGAVTHVWAFVGTSPTSPRSRSPWRRASSRRALLVRRAP